MIESKQIKIAHTKPINTIVYLLMILMISSCSVENESSIISLNEKIKDIIIPSNKGTSLPYLKNAKAGDYIEDGNSFRLILIDVNKNNVYNEKGIDELYLDGKGVDYSNISYGYFKSSLKENLLINAGGIIYELSEFADNGESLEISKITTNLPEKVDINFPSRIPSMEVSLMTGEKIRLTEKIGEKYIYLEFWYSGCAGCLQRIPNVNELSEKYQDKLLIYGVNSIDDGTYARKIIKDKNFLNPSNHIIGSESSNLMGLYQKVMIHPRGFLYNAKGELMNIHIMPEQLESVLPLN